MSLTLVTSLLRGRFPQDWPRPDQTLRTTMGLSLRSPYGPHQCLGNQAAVTHVTLPCGEPSAQRRLQLLREQVTRERLVESRKRQAPLMRRLPYWCGKLFVRIASRPRFASLVVADVRVRTALAFGGVRARAAYVLPPWPPHQPLFIAWTSYGDQLHTTFIAHDELPGHDPLADLWRQAVDDLEAGVHTT